MPRMTGQNISVAANATTTNQLAGLQHEFLERPASVLLAAAAAAVGINVTFLIAGVTVVDDQPISQANRFPVIPDDVITEERGVGRMVLRFRNTTGAAIVVNGFSVDVDYS